jgi:hypothetical protein
VLSAPSNSFLPVCRPVRFELFGLSYSVPDSPVTNIFRIQRLADLLAFLSFITSRMINRSCAAVVFLFLPDPFILLRVPSSRCFLTILFTFDFDSLNRLDKSSEDLPILCSVTRLAQSTSFLSLPLIFFGRISNNLHCKQSKCAKIYY